MKTVALIQARCASTRLPNKVLMDLCGKPVLQHVIERVQRSKNVDETMVITSIEKENLPILALCASLGIRCFCGSEQDVLDRYYQAARLITPEMIVRVTADCPLYDAAFLDNAFEQMNGRYDYAGQLSKETYPDGLDIEIFTYAALERSWKEARLSSEREHVTQYIRKHPELFCLLDLQCPLGDYGNERWTLDEPEDYQLIHAICMHFPDGAAYSAKDVIDYLDSDQKLREINGRFTRNEGLQKSLQFDSIVK